MTREEARALVAELMLALHKHGLLNYWCEEVPGGIVAICITTKEDGERLLRALRQEDAS